MPKINLETKVKNPIGFDMPPVNIDGNVYDFTLGFALRFAFASDPLHEQGPQTGSPRPINAEEQAAAVKYLPMLSEGGVVELQSEEITQLKAVARRLGAVASTGIALALERTAIVE